jgi:hypothetical protein
VSVTRFLSERTFDNERSRALLDRMRAAGRAQAWQRPRRLDAAWLARQGKKIVDLLVLQWLWSTKVIGRRSNS